MKHSIHCIRFILCSDQKEWIVSTCDDVVCSPKYDVKGKIIETILTI